MKKHTRDPSTGRLLVYHKTEPSHFASQIDEISEKFELVDIGSALERLNGITPGESRRCFAVVTFDDGHRDFLAVMDDLLRRGVPACLYITKEWLDRPGYLRASEVRSISQAFDVGSHTNTHPRLLGLDEGRLVQETRGFAGLLGRPRREAGHALRRTVRWSLELRSDGGARCSGGWIRDVPDDVPRLERPPVPIPCRSPTSAGGRPRGLVPVVARQAGAFGSARLASLVSLAP